MQFSAFKSLIEAFMIRDATTILAQGTSLTTVINATKQYAQLLHDFEYCRTTVTYSVTPGSDTGTAYSANTDYIDGSTARDVKRIEAAALVQGQPLNVIDAVGYRRMIQRATGRTVDETDPSPSAPYTTYLVTQNNRIYLRGENIGSSALSVRADVVYFLPDYSADSDEDFFLTRGLDWMIMAVCQRLNFYLKDDERLRVNTDLMRDSWAALLNWDGQLHVPTDQYSGD